MGDISYLGKKRINTNTDIVGDLTVSGSANITDSILIAGAEPVTFGALQKMVITL